MLNRFLFLLAVLTLSACSTWDVNPPSEADQKANSCREDPYQDMCR